MTWTKASAEARLLQICQGTSTTSYTNVSGAEVSVGREFYCPPDDYSTLNLQLSTPWSPTTVLQFLLPEARYESPGNFGISHAAHVEWWVPLLGAVVLARLRFMITREFPAIARDVIEMRNACAAILPSLESPNQMHGADPVTVLWWMTNAEFNLLWLQ